MITLKNPEENRANGRTSRKTLKSPNEEKKVVWSLENPDLDFEQSEAAGEQPAIAEISQSGETSFNTERGFETAPSYAELQGRNKREKSVAKDKRLLNSDRWSMRKDHTFTYIGIFLFTFILYFRPYELIPGLSGFSSMTSIAAIAAIVFYMVTQLSSGKLITVFSTEVKCVLFLFFWVLLTMPLAKDPGVSWTRFDEAFSKVVLIFVIMVNTLQTRLRLKGLMWLGIGVGIMVSYQAVLFYREGVFKTDGYRVSGTYNGMFGNPNDMALHLVLFIPIAFVLGIATKNKAAKAVYFLSAGILTAGIMVTQSRGGSLGLIAISAVLVWKLGKKQRLKVTAIALVIGLAVMAFAPGNYGLRMASIFVPSLDPVGSSEQRSELLQQSIIVTLRNPLGIGFGNFPLVGLDNKETHNAYTQVSAELGWLAFAVYLILIISPLRKLGAVERKMSAEEDYSWIYYLSIGLQASIVGYMVSSFFGSVAFNWFIYYPIAYAVCLRRIYQSEQLPQAADSSELRAV